MLVLSRKPNQKVLIGDGVAVEVLSVKGNQVRLGIMAPISVPVRREELGCSEKQLRLECGPKVKGPLDEPSLSEALALCENVA